VVPASQTAVSMVASPDAGFHSMEFWFRSNKTDWQGRGEEQNATPHCA